jgi:hypothetical protein
MKLYYCKNYLPIKTKLHGLSPRANVLVKCFLLFASVLVKYFCECSSEVLFASVLVKHFLRVF